VLLVIAGGVFFAQRRFDGKDKSRAQAGVATSDSSGSLAMSGGTLVEGDVGLPTTFNPLLAKTQTEQDLAKLMFDGLVRVDGSGMPQPDLAQKWDISKDGLIYTLTLRPGLTWHDGAPLTSQDVRFTIGLVQSPNFPGNQQLSQFWRPIVVETPNDETVVFHLMEPFAPFLNNLELPIVPKHLLGGVLAQDLVNDPFNLSPVGTGPFKFESFDQSKEEISLGAFDHYAGTRPGLNSITIRYFTDTDKLLDAMKKGSIQSTGTLTADQIMRSGALPKDDRVYAPTLMSYTALFFNTRIAPFSNEVVRQALQLAIDPTVLTDGPLQGQVASGRSPIPPSSWAHSVQQISSDPAKAATMLEQAGWKFDASAGVLENGGTSLSFQLLVNTDDPQRMLMAQTIAQQLGDIHVHVDIQPTSPDEVNQALTSRQFSAAIFGGHYANGDPDCLDVWHSTESNSGLNITGLSDETIDKSLADARSTLDVNRRQQLYANFQQEFVMQAPAVVLYYPRFLFVVSSDVHGVAADPIVDPSDRFQQISSWYLGNAPASTATP
jgi:peptide/nickel transport system substrate-binding protein